MIGKINILKLWHKIKYNYMYKFKNIFALADFLKPFNIVEYDLKASIEYAKIRASFEKQGKVIGELDMLIAAHSKSLEMTLVTNNTKEFERIDDLILDNWVK